MTMSKNICPHFIQFYGTLGENDDFWICTELMDTSLDRLNEFVYHKLHQCIPESVLAYANICCKDVFLME